MSPDDLQFSQQALKNRTPSNKSASKEREKLAVETPAGFNQNTARNKALVHRRVTAKNCYNDLKIQKKQSRIHFSSSCGSFLTNNWG